MSDNILDGFIEKKKAESQFLSIADGESVRIEKLNKVELTTKPGYDGKPKEVLRLTCEVKTSLGIREKWFDNGTNRFAQELAKKLGANPIGCGFTLTRAGESSQTRYTVSDVTQPAA